MKVIRQDDVDDFEALNDMQNSQELFDIKKQKGEQNNAKSQAYKNDYNNQSQIQANANSLDKNKMISELQIEQLEQRDNLEMQSKKSQLEQL